jgi:hypothetical protein
MRPIFFGCFTALLLSLAAGGQSPASHANTPTPAAKIEIRPIPPELLRRFDPLHAALKPSAKAWVEQQAKIEAKRAKPDLNALRAAIRQRFASSRPDNAAVDTFAFLVLMRAVQNMQAVINSCGGSDIPEQNLTNMLSSYGDDQCMSSSSLTNMLQQQQASLIALTNIEKTLHDTDMSIIANMK